MNTLLPTPAMQMLAIDLAVLVPVFVCLMRRRAARVRHARRVREILGRPRARRFWQRQPLKVTVSYGAPRRQVEARPPARSAEQKQLDQERFDSIGLPRAASAA